MVLLIVSFLLFFFFRLINLNLIPVFADEAIYIHWAQLAWHDSTLRFISLTDGKPPLQTWLMIPFLKVINDPLIAGRLLSILAGLMTFIGVYLLAKKIFNRQIGQIALLLIAISPFLVFYDRLAVADSLLSAFGVWTFYLSLLLIEKPDLGKAFLLGFCWGGGLLTKPPALYFVVLSPLVIFLREKIVAKKIGQVLGYGMLSLIMSWAIYNVIKLSPYSQLIGIRSYDYIVAKREFLKHPFQLLGGNLKAIIPWIYSYQTLLPTILFILGLFLLLKRDWKKALVFFGWLIIPILGSASIGKIIFPRYFLFAQPWIIIFMSYGLVFLMEKTKSIIKKLPIIRYLLFIILISSWLYFSLLIIFKPEKAPLIQREQDQYLTTWAAGYGIKEIAFWLKNNYPKEHVYVATEGYFGTLPDGLQIYLIRNPNIEVYGVGQPLDKVPDNTLEKAKKSPTFLVINSTRYYGSGQNLELIQSYPKPVFPFLKESLLFFKVKAE